MPNQQEDYVHALLQCSNKISSEELSSMTFTELIYTPQIPPMLIYLNKCVQFEKKRLFIKIYLSCKCLINSYE